MARVLVIEPTPDLALVLRARLSLDGHRVLVLDGLPAARGLGAWRPEAVVLGLVPGDDGSALCALLRGRWPWAKLVLLTTSPDPAFPDRMRAAGADACVVEPFDPDQLAAEVDRLLATVGRARRGVLVVDVRSDAAARLARVVEWAGYPVEVVHGLAAARARLAKEPSPALVLLALPGPTRDALDFCREASRSGRPLVLVAPRPPREFRQQALASGCTHVVPDPLDADGLQAVLRLALGDLPDRRRRPRAS